jgi:hypothetical protein
MTNHNRNQNQKQHTNGQPTGQPNKMTQGKGKGELMNGVNILEIKLGAKRNSPEIFYVT